MSTNIASFPGTSLSESDITSGRVLTTNWTLRAEYAWDEGVAMGRYLAALKEGVILGVRCRRCERTVVPPRVFCERCFHPMSEFVPLADTGTVNTFSLCYVTWDVKRITEPQIPAVIDIDGTSPRVGLLHLLGEVEPDAVHVGMKVKAVWKPAEERTGAITDIRYFKPESQKMHELLQRVETIAAIREGLAAAERGESKPTEQVFAEMKAKYGIQG